MTSLETGQPGTLTSVAVDHIVLCQTVGHAVRRDLDRFDRVLGEPVTAVRREALVRHLRFLLDELAAQFAELDTVIWPAAVASSPDLAEVQAQVRLGHAEIADVFVAARRCALHWTDSAQGRDTTRTAIRKLAAAVGPILDQDADLLPLAFSEIGTPAPCRRVLDLRTPPTRAAKRLFWLLDDLDPQSAARLLRGIHGATLWMLRNGFSGAYNRGSYLMWVGGGTGPAS